MRSPSPPTALVTVRAYGPLADFLPAHRRQQSFVVALDGHPSVKDLVERIGIPHPEIDLLVVNGVSMGFDYAVQTGDRIALFPVFWRIGVDGVSRVQPQPLANTRFVADVHLGTLARRLRLAGIDTRYSTDADDAAIAATAERDGRILLTRDVGLLKRRAVKYGYFVRQTRPHDQFVEVLRRYGPLPLRPFTRCLRCNDLLDEVSKQSVDDLLAPLTREHYHAFRRCRGCRRVYWQGSHWARLQRALETALAEAALPDVPSGRAT